MVQVLRSLQVPSHARKTMPNKHSKPTAINSELPCVVMGAKMPRPEMILSPLVKSVLIQTMPSLYDQISGIPFYWTFVESSEARVRPDDTEAFDEWLLRSKERYWTPGLPEIGLLAPSIVTYRSRIETPSSTAPEPNAEASA